MASNPTLLVQPIAQNGNKNAIPNTTNTSGAMSQSLGFPPETSLPLGAGGVAPSREDFNGAFNLLSGIAFYNQKGWIFAWDSGQAYYKGCEVIDSTNSKKYRCKADVAAGAAKPSSNTTSWELAEVDLSTYAPINSPAFTGTPTAPTATAGTNTTQIATTAFVKAAIENGYVKGNDFTIIYPNNGTAANPANITKDTRYVESNPFPGYYVNAVVEILINNQWGEPPYESTGASNSGVRVTQFNDGDLIITTASNYLLNNGKPQAYPWLSSDLPSVVTTAPARVKVWKIGKI